MRKMSTAARDELVTAPARRYAACTRAEKTRILDEFEAVAGFRRKYAMRVLRTDATRRHAEGRAGRRIYDDAVRDALVVLREASDRICGKRRGHPSAIRRRILQLPYGIGGAVGLGSRGEHLDEATPSTLGSILG